MRTSRPASWLNQTRHKDAPFLSTGGVRRPKPSQRGAKLLMVRPLHADAAPPGPAEDLLLLLRSSIGGWIALKAAAARRERIRVGQHHCSALCNTCMMVAMGKSLPALTRHPSQ